jgi:hypothetical protein
MRSKNRRDQALATVPTQSREPHARRCLGELLSQAQFGRRQS